MWVLWAVENHQPYCARLFAGGPLASASCLRISCPAWQASRRPAAGSCRRYALAPLARAERLEPHVQCRMLLQQRLRTCNQL